MYVAIKKLMFSLCLGVLFFAAPAQVDVDLGITGGTSFYLGDINPDKLFYNHNFSYGGFIRFNAPDARYSLRLNGLMTTIEASDDDFDNPYQQNRQASFQTNIGEISAFVEFNFLPFIVPLTSKKHERFSPFLLSGLTYSSSTYSSSTMAIPIGVGVKILVLGKITGQVEWIVKKTFTDGLDNLSDPINTGSSSIFFNNDWYSYTGFSLSFEMFQGKKDCTSYDTYIKREKVKRNRFLKSK